MSKINFEKLFTEFESNVAEIGGYPAILQLLIDELGITKESLKKLGIGVNPLTGAYVYPERDDQGKIIGIAQRTLDGKKFAVKGSKRGLVYSLNPKFTEAQSIPSKEYEWIRIADAGVSCGICGKPDWCMVSGDPADPVAILCSRIQEGSKFSIKDCGYVHILKPEGDLRSNYQGLLPDTKDPVIVVEGYSDTAAAMDLGFVAIGRPFAEGSSKFLSGLLRGKEVIIIGDNDAGAGKKGMETVFEVLRKICPSVIKVLPPGQYDDLRQWKNQLSLTKVSFLRYIQEEGESGGDPNILLNDKLDELAETFITRQKIIDGCSTLILLTEENDWLQYRNGYYAPCKKNEIDKDLIDFFKNKQYSKIGAKGDTTLVDIGTGYYRIRDIKFNLKSPCLVTAEAPCWLKGVGRPDPSDLIIFRDKILDVNEYVKGNIKLYNATPALFSFNALPYDFDPDLESELWNSFLRDIFNGDEKRIELLAQWFGYNCTPDMSYEKLMLCTGRPRSGKGTVLDTLKAMLGGKRNYAPSSFKSLSGRFGGEKFIGKLAIILSDAHTNDKREAAAALDRILPIVGGDSVGAEQKNKKDFDHSPTYKFTIAMNELPNIPDQANSLEPKLNLLYFENSYQGREDLSLKRRLKKDANEGRLINFALRGLRSLRQAQKFIVPESSSILTHQLREITSPITAFISECIIQEPPNTPQEQEYYEEFPILYEAWVNWCAATREFPGNYSHFKQWFPNSCPSSESKRISIKGKRVYIRKRIKLSPEACEQYLGVNRQQPQ